MCLLAGLRAVSSSRNAFAFVDKPLVDFGRKTADEMPRMRNDPEYAVCVCGGQGDCLVCKERETDLILKSWP